MTSPVQPDGTSAIGVDFANGVRTLLRQDPTSSWSGDPRLRYRRHGGAGGAYRASGFSTLHTNDAPTAVTLLDLNVPPYLLNSTLLGVMAQRLVRTLCPHCKPGEPPDDEMWRAITSPWREKPASVMAPEGCPNAG